MHDDELLRYSRHILLSEIGIEGQEKLLEGRALVIVAGAKAHGTDPDRVRGLGVRLVELVGRVP